MNNFVAKYGSELLNIVGVKTSGDSSLGNSPSIKRAKFVKKFEMKVTTLHSYGLLRRDTPSPQNSNYKDTSNEKVKGDPGRKLDARGRIIYTHEYPIDPNNVVASIHQNLSRYPIISEQSTFMESRDDENVLKENEDDGRDTDSTSNVFTNERQMNDVLDDDCDSVCTDCLMASCTLSVDDIYNEDELLGLAFISD
ncbi:hypothetical protein HJC23_002087 [Cyclotella cryptica]|uniref:Uncharacterized protein n=1 Tax=Cyclotella cryptica TaxID=29204 RepID=A0ABD3P6M0_9STRA